MTLLVFRAPGQTNSSSQEVAIRRQISSAEAITGALNGGIPPVFEMVECREDLRDAVTRLRSKQAARRQPSGANGRVDIWIVVLAPASGDKADKERKDLVMSLPESVGSTAVVSVGILQDVVGPLVQREGFSASTMVHLTIVWDPLITLTPLAPAWSQKTAAGQWSRLQSGLQEFSRVAQGEVAMSLEFDFFCPTADSTKRPATPEAEEDDETQEDEEDGENEGESPSISAFYNRTVPRVCECFFRAIGGCVRGSEGSLVKEKEEMMLRGLTRVAVIAAVNEQLEKGFYMLRSSKALKTLKIPFLVLFEASDTVSLSGAAVPKPTADSYFKLLVSRYAPSFLDESLGEKALTVAKEAVVSLQADPPTARRPPSSTSRPAPPPSEGGDRESVSSGATGTTNTTFGPASTSSNRNSESGSIPWIGTKNPVEEPPTVPTSMTLKKVFTLRSVEAIPGDRIDRFEGLHNTFRSALLTVNPWLRKCLGDRESDPEACFPRKQEPIELSSTYAHPLIVNLPQFEAVLLRPASLREIGAFVGFASSDLGTLHALNASRDILALSEDKLPAGNRVFVPFYQSNRQMSLDTSQSQPRITLSIPEGKSPWLLDPIYAVPEKPLFSGPVVLPKEPGGRTGSEALRENGYDIPDLNRLNIKQLNELATEGVPNSRFPVQRWCCFCWTDVSGNDNWEKHVVGEKHRKKVSHHLSSVLPPSAESTTSPSAMIPPFFGQSFMPSQPPPQQPSAPGGIRLADLDTRFITSIGPYPAPELDQATKKPKCLLCNEILDGISWPKHAASKSHQINVTRNEESYGGAKAQYVCLACNAQISGIENLQRHLNGIRHQKKLALCMQEDKARMKEQQPATVPTPLNPASAPFRPAGTQPISVGPPGYPGSAVGAPMKPDDDPEYFRWDPFTADPMGQPQTTHKFQDPSGEFMSSTDRWASLGRVSQPPSAVAQWAPNSTIQ